MMKRMTTILALACSVGVGLAFLASSTPAAADPGAALTTIAVSGPTAMGDYEYVGSSKCKKCHIKEYKSWAKTKMGMSFDSLQPGAAAEAKKAHDLDPEKDYSKDESCVGCHTTGHGHKGGYFFPDEADKKAVKKAKKLQGVGCEMCHGPGSEYIKIFQEITKSKRSYKVEELYAAGLTKIDESTCAACHNDKSATFDSAKPFDYEKQKEEGIHEHVALKQREE